MKSKFNHIFIKTLMPLMILSVMLTSLLFALTSQHLTQEIEANLVDLKRQELEAKKVNLEQSMLKIEAAMQVIQYSVGTLYDAYHDSPDLLMSQTQSLITQYLQDENCVSDSVYLYFDTPAEKTSQALWLQSDAGGIHQISTSIVTNQIEEIKKKLPPSLQDDPQAMWATPYYNTRNKYITSYIVPLIYDDQLIGIIGMDWDLKYIQGQLGMVNFNEDDYYWLVDNQQNIVFHPVLSTGVHIVALDKESELYSSVSSHEDWIEAPCVYYQSELYIGWKLLRTINGDCLIAESQTISTLELIIAVSLLLFLLGLSYVVYLIYKKKFTAIFDVLKASRLGDYSKRLPYTSNDEIGELSFSINSIQDTMYTYKMTMEQLAYHNPLTTYPNKHKLMHDLAYMTKDQNVILYLVDVDNYFSINQMIGQSHSQKLLCTLAYTFGQLSKNSLLLYHTSENIFAFVEYASNYDMIEKRSAAIHDAIMHFTFSEHGDLSLTVSIGIAKYPDDTMDNDELWTCAETALEEARAAGGNCTKIFSRFNAVKESNIQEIHKDIITSLDGGEFKVLYQPIYDQQQMVLGLEALLRWYHPVRGIIYPDGFLEVAEKTGIINELGLYVIQTVCDDIEELKKHKAFPAYVSINLSTRQLLNPTLTSTLLNKLRSANISPSELEVEIKEDNLMMDSKSIQMKLTALSVAGINIALDDFGTSNNVISNILDIPLKRIKLDQILIHRIQKDERTTQFIQSLITFVHDLHLEVTAEGVEDSQQLNFLIAAGCDAFQGYHMSHPLTLKEYLNTRKKDDKSK